MGRVKEAPFHVRSDRGRAVLDYVAPDGRRRKVALGLEYTGRLGATGNRAVQEAAEAKWRELTDGRVVVEHARITSDRTLAELYRAYTKRWAAPEGASINERQALLKGLGVRRVYGNHIQDWASDESLRPDGSRRWLKDRRTPLERLLADGGADEFLSWRLQLVTRSTMKKEKSNLCLFFEWLKAHHYIKSLPAVSLPKGAGTKKLSNGRGYVIDLKPTEAARIVAAMPVWSNRASRKQDQVGRFLVRPFFDFMSMTGLREATIERLEVPRNWQPGRKSIRLDDADDKAKYGREFPLTDAAAALLTEYAPDVGHIFGHHDFRKHVKAAAAIVFADRPELAEKFGGYHLRHFIGTYLAGRAGTNLPAVQHVLGHKDLGTTSKYVHATEADARTLLEAVEQERGKAAKAAAKWASKRAKDAAGVQTESRRKPAVP